jgi:hypothetical protein
MLRVTLDCGDVELEFEDGSTTVTEVKACDCCSELLRERIAEQEAQRYQYSN